jgi:hypothetical protein
VSSILVPVAELPTLQAPDADWDALHASALVEIQEGQAHALQPWTDHNTHDPGITLLEAVLWALADLHYRTTSRSFEAWPLELAEWRGVPLAEGADRDAVAEAYRIATGPAPEPDVGAILAAAPSRARAIVELTGLTVGTAKLSAAAAGALVRLLREPLLLQAALDGSGAVEEAVRDAATTADAERAVAAALAGLRLWPEEVAALVARERLRQLVRRLRESREALLAAIAAAPVGGIVTALETAFNLTQPEARAALAFAPCPGVGPQVWESQNGETTLWPPHPIQARTCEPVTRTDYRRLLLAAPGVRRAWVLPGLAAGVLWDGSKTKAYPYRRGAFTFLIQAATEPENQLKFLRDCLAAVTRVDADPETVEPLFDFRSPDRLDHETPRRLLGDELGAALVGACRVVVRGSLEIGPTANTAQVLAEVRSRLSQFLSAERIAPFEAPDPPGPPLACPRDLDGAWPPAEKVDDYVADPTLEVRESGWLPGTPVHVTELVQLLQGVTGVLGVDGLEVELENELDPQKPQGWQRTTLELYPYCVPEFAWDCLCVQIVDPRECGA